MPEEQSDGERFDEGRAGLGEEQDPGGPQDAAKLIGGALRLWKVMESLMAEDQVYRRFRQFQGDGSSLAQIHAAAAAPALVLGSDQEIGIGIDSHQHRGPERRIEQLKGLAGPTSNIEN